MSQGKTQGMSQDENISQFFPNAQQEKLSIEDKIEQALAKFNSQLMTQNNSSSEDRGVNDVLLALCNNDNRLKALKKNTKILKTQLLAGLGFLHNIDLQQASERFKGITVERLQNMIVERYELLSPTLCNHCEEIYDAKENDLGA